MVELQYCLICRSHLDDGVPDLNQPLCLTLHVEHYIHEQGTPRPHQLLQQRDPSRIPHRTHPTKAPPNKQSSFPPGRQLSCYSHGHPSTYDRVTQPFLQTLTLSPLLIRTPRHSPRTCQRFSI